MKDFCGIRTDPRIYKPVRPSQIIRSEKLVSYVAQALAEDYVNPSGVNVDINHLIYLALECLLKCKNLLSMPNRGQEYYKIFIKIRSNKKDMTHLLYLSNVTGRMINLEKALNYLFDTVPLSLCKRKHSVRC